jgi:hypothetical protein
MKTPFTILFLLFSIFAIAQDPTVGLLYHNSNVSEGYTLFTPEKSTNVYLINNCGELIHQWSFSEQPGATCYLLENGNLLRAGKDSIEIRDWESNQLWSYATTNNGIAQHHDIEPLPNGNILCVVTEVFTSDAIANEGRDPDITLAPFRIDKIIEIEPIGAHDANIVWEWKISDHLIQDFDNTKENYGVVEDHPELVDINFYNGQNRDWTHVNAVEYNAELDQILITVRHLSEIIIIDHSTTTEEASGHTGGTSAMGGDILWRWGNPQVYRQGTSVDQKLKWPHDAKWVKSDYLDGGKISVFNNNFDGTGSESFVHLIVPEMDGFHYSMYDNTFLPIDYDWSFGGELLGETLFADRKSSMQSLPNGNVFILEYSRATIFEITKSGELLWAYRNPVGAEIVEQFSTVNNSYIGIFRAEKYPPDYPGFEGKDLTPQGILENINEISDDCMQVNIESSEYGEPLKIKTNPIENGRIVFNQDFSANTLKIIDLNGRIFKTLDSFRGNSIQTYLKQGMYFIQIFTDNDIIIEKVFVQ